MQAAHDSAYSLRPATTITEGKVAGYVAKYATKGTEAATGTLDHRLKKITELWTESVPEHGARMIRTAWTSVPATTSST